jgi:hypothetical protein
VVGRAGAPVGGPTKDIGKVTNAHPGEKSNLTGNSSAARVEPVGISRAKLRNILRYLVFLFGNYFNFVFISWDCFGFGFGFDLIGGNESGVGGIGRFALQMIAMRFGQRQRPHFYFYFLFLNKNKFQDKKFALRFILFLFDKKIK